MFTHADFCVRPLAGILSCVIMASFSGAFAGCSTGKTSPSPDSRPAVAATDTPDSRPAVSAVSTPDNRSATGASSASEANSTAEKDARQSAAALPGFQLSFDRIEPADPDNPEREPPSGWMTDANYRLRQEDGALRVDGAKTSQPDAAFSYGFEPLDLSAQPIVSVAVKASRDVNMNVALEDAAGNRAFLFAVPPHEIIADKDFSIHTFHFAQIEKVDLSKVTAIRFSINPDAPTFVGTIWLDDLKTGGMAIQAPEMTGIPDWQIPVGTVSRRIPIYGIRPFSQTDSPIEIHAKSDRPDLVPDPLVTMGKGGTASLELRPLPGKAGTAIISLTASSGGAPGGKVESFKVRVEPNNPPVMGKVPNWQIQSGKAVQIALSSIDDGNPEARQQMTLSAASSNPDLIPSPVVVHNRDDRWGSLTLTPIAGKSGEADITVTLQDDGGTAAGGQDASHFRFHVQVFETINQPPKVDAIRGVSLVEGEAARIITLQGIADGDIGVNQRMRISAVSSDATLLPDPVATFGKAGTARLALKTMTGRTGKAAITVTLADDGAKPGNNGNASTQFTFDVDIRPRPVTGFQDGFNDGMTDPVWTNSGEGAHACVEKDGSLRIDVDKFKTNNQWAGLWFTLPTEMDLSKHPYVSLRMKTDKPADMLIFLWDASDVYNTAGTVRHFVEEDYVEYHFDFTGQLLSDKGGKVDLSRIRALLINFAPGRLYKGTWWFDDLAVGDRVKPPAGGWTLPENSGSGSRTEPAAENRTEPANGSEGEKQGKPFVARITVDKANRFQEMDGFGAFLGSGQVGGDMQDLLLPMVKDMGMTMARFGVIDTEFEPRNDNADPFVTDYSAFNPDALPLDWMKTLKDHTSIDKFIVTMWSPPAWMKKSKALASYSGAITNKLDPRNYEEYAEHMAALVKTVRERTGIDLHAISLQNEPQFNEPYASCILLPEDYRDLLKVVGPRFREEGITTKIFMAEALPQQGSIDDYIQAVAADPEARKYMDIVAIHNYDADGIKVGGPGAREWAQIYDWAQEGAPRKTWMTETSGHSNDWAGAANLAGNIFNALASGNASAWLFWSFNVIPDSVEYGLLANGVPTSRYAVSRQFYKHVRPGMIRIGAASSQADVLPLAFLDPASGKPAVLVLINRSNAPCTVILDGPDLPGRWSVETTTQKGWNRPGAEVVGHQASLPPNSVVTLNASDLAP